jgi:hypothetical protein
MAGKVEVRSLQPFPGPGNRKVKPGETCWVHATAADALVRSRRAEYVQVQQPAHLPVAPARVLSTGPSEIKEERSLLGSSLGSGLLGSVLAPALPDPDSMDKSELLDELDELLPNHKYTMRTQTRYLVAAVIKARG